MYPFYTFITRINQEIKINWYRIDFSEIERVIMNFPQIKRCVCLGISKTEFIKIIVVVLTCKNSSKYGYTAKIYFRILTCVYATS